MVASSVVSSILFKDELIDHFIREANKHINTPIEIGKINVSALDNFPRMTLHFKDVYVQESYPNSSYPLIEADEIEFTFNPIAIYRGNYSIEQVHITNAKCHFKVNEKGESNYLIIKKQEESSNQQVKFDLSKVTLKNIDFKYTNIANEVFIEVSTEASRANVSIDNQLYDINAQGDFFISSIVSGENELFMQKAATLDASLLYNDSLKHIKFRPSAVEINQSKYSVYGEYDFLHTPEISIYAEARQTNIQSIVALLPENVGKKLSPYRSEGDVYFDLALTGKMGDEHSPSLKINFGLKNASLLYPEKDLQIKNAHTEGLFKADQLKHIDLGILHLKNTSGELDGKKFTANLMLENFNQPYIDLNFNGELDIHSVLEFVNDPHVKEADGVAQVDFSLKGNIYDLKKKQTAHRVDISGELDVKQATLVHEDLILPLKKITGNFIFNNNDLAISNLKGFYGTSDFIVNGFFKNIVAFLLFDNEPIGIEADLAADYINLDELLSRETAEDSRYAFSISPRVILNFNCNIDRLTFRRFNGSNIRGDLKIKNQVAFTDRLQFSAMGGTTILSGMVDATNETALAVSSNFSVQEVHIDSIFYVFENFNQSFLVDDHLEGQIQADVATNMYLNQQLHLIPSTLTANIDTRIKGGELNNFEPMQKLAKYVDEDKLDHLTFSELRNEIHVENETIYLPQMEVSSNVTDIKISGTHTFNQDINYRVIAPLNSRKKIDPDEAFGAIEEDRHGRSMLYLKIVGTTDDYNIIYDKESVKQKIASDLKKEVQELKDAFKNKGLDKTKTIELEEDDFFDWEEDDGGS